MVTICCDPSSEPSHGDGSEHMLLCRINKNYPQLPPNTPAYLEILILIISVLECPHIDFLPSLTSSDQLLKLSCEEKDEPCLIVHMSPSHIVEMPEYQEFMNRSVLL